MPIIVDGSWTHDGIPRKKKKKIPAKFSEFKIHNHTRQLMRHSDTPTSPPGVSLPKPTPNQPQPHSDSLHIHLGGLLSSPSSPLHPASPSSHINRLHSTSLTSHGFRRPSRTGIRVRTKWTDRLEFLSGPRKEARQRRGAHTSLSTIR